jgi:hypothetical protein
MDRWIDPATRSGESFLNRHKRFFRATSNSGKAPRLTKKAVPFAMLRGIGAP